jgi:hypothetical protein
MNAGFENEFFLLKSVLRCTMIFSFCSLKILLELLIKKKNPVRTILNVIYELMQRGERRMGANRLNKLLLYIGI